MKKNTKIKLIGFLSAVLVILVSGLWIYFQNMPYILFDKSEHNLEINEEYDPLHFISKVNKLSIDDVQVDIQQVDIHKLGDYMITYTLDNRTYELEVHVVDTVAPEFDVVEQESDAGIPLEASAFVKNIVDETMTKVEFKEAYSFDEEGDFDFIVVVSDEAQNKTEKVVHVHILPKDEIAPVISAQEKISLYKGSQFDPLKDVSVSDNQDKNVQVKVVSNDVDTSKVGTYHVVFEAEDRSHNKTTFTQTITILEEKKTQYSGEKVVYLTFDDGPSYNTKEVLKILDQYHIKATFFVTGFSSAYRSYIQE
ncbi:MAG: immunoglobulin-like domain-containing protein, partial [Traorella sp.]